MKKWGMQITLECVLCQEAEESIEHLFFECKETAAMWHKIQRMCLVYSGSYGWSEELAWTSENWKTKAFPDRIKRAAMAITVYHIWK